MFVDFREVYFYFCSWWTGIIFLEKTCVVSDLDCNAWVIIWISWQILRLYDITTKHFLHMIIFASLFRTIMSYSSIFQWKFRLLLTLCLNSLSISRSSCKRRILSWKERYFMDQFSRIQILSFRILYYEGITKIFIMSFLDEKEWRWWKK